MVEKGWLYGCVYPFLFVGMKIVLWGYSGHSSIPTPPPCPQLYGCCTCFYSLAGSPLDPCAGTEFEFPPSTAYPEEVMSHNRLRKRTVSLQLESSHITERSATCTIWCLKSAAWIRAAPAWEGKKWLSPWRAAVSVKGDVWGRSTD